MLILTLRPIPGDPAAMRQRPEEPDRVQLKPQQPPWH